MYPTASFLKDSLKSDGLESASMGIPLQNKNKTHLQDQIKGILEKNRNENLLNQMSMLFFLNISSLYSCTGGFILHLCTPLRNKTDTNRTPAYYIFNF